MRLSLLSLMREKCLNFLGLLEALGLIQDFPEDGYFLAMREKSTCFCCSALCVLGGSLFFSFSFFIRLRQTLKKRPVFLYYRHDVSEKLFLDSLSRVTTTVKVGIGSSLSFFVPQSSNFSSVWAFV